MNAVIQMMAALEGALNPALGAQMRQVWKNRRGSMNRYDVKARQRRWIARRHQDGAWRYDGRVTEGKAA